MHVLTRSDTLHALRVLRNERIALHRRQPPPTPEEISAARTLLRGLSALQLLEELVAMENVLGDALKQI